MKLVALVYFHMSLPLFVLLPLQQYYVGKIQVNSPFRHVCDCFLVITQKVAYVFHDPHC